MFVMAIDAFKRVNEKTFPSWTDVLEVVRLAVGEAATIKVRSGWLRDAQRYPVLVDFKFPRGEVAPLLKVGSQASVVVYTGEHWLMNPLARLQIWAVSLLTYAY